MAEGRARYSGAEIRVPPGQRTTRDAAGVPSVRVARRFERHEGAAQVALLSGSKRVARFIGLIGAFVLAGTSVHAEERVVPPWLRADIAARTVTVDLAAGVDKASGSWHFNGFANGDATLVVPTGWRVTMQLANHDPDVPHSVMVIAAPADESEIPASAEDTQPAIPGASSPRPTEGIGPGQAETIAFTAAPAGDYLLFCGVPGHGVTGMWLRFEVEDGAAQPYVLAGKS